MAAYVIATVSIKDEARYAQYRAMVPATLQQYGGRFVVRGGAVETLEGDWKPGRVVVLEFADAAAARRWYDSPEYAPAKALRHDTSEGKLILVEGV
jgi:uncharacterized protein (DUF1330 family)